MEYRRGKSIKTVALILLIFVAILSVAAQVTEDTIVYVTKTGEKYHSAGCRYLSKSSIAMRLGDAVKRYSPCSVCSPPTLKNKGVSQTTTIQGTAEKPSIKSYQGRVVGITDGDTIKVLIDGKEVVIRLNGIDAPESTQDFGQKAKQVCSELCFGYNVRVEVIDTDKYGRIVADIYLPDGESLNREMVRFGMAWHYKQYSSDEALAMLEEIARKNKRGLWIMSNAIPPWEYRK